MATEAGARADASAMRLELAPPVDGDARPLLDLLYGFRKSKTLFCAVQLGVFDGHRREGVAFERLLAACEALGLLQATASGYANTELANRYLRTHVTGTLTGYIRYSNAASYTLWSDLEGAVTQDASRWETVFGADACAKKSSVLNSRDFASGMDGLGLLSTPAVVARFDLSRFKFLIDLGGGTGHVATEAARRYPSLRVAVVDVQPVLEIAKEYVPPEIQLIAADFCVDPLPPADLFVLGRILHHRSDAMAVALLRKLHAALPKGGGVLVVEALLDNPDSATAANAHMHSLNMLVCTDGGRERTSAEYVDLLNQGGFENPEVGITRAPMDAILAIK